MATTDYVTKIRQLVCGLHGHDTLMEFGRGRLSLKCVSCGHETPGWDIKPQSRVAPQGTGTPVERRIPALFTGARRLHDAFPQM
ncbi:MAG: hypothetical protein U0Q55_22470 [Vicinamibacterales bacterium]